MTNVHPIFRDALRAIAPPPVIASRAFQVKVKTVGGTEVVNIIAPDWKDAANRAVEMVLGSDEMPDTGLLLAIHPLFDIPREAA